VNVWWFLHVFCLDVPLQLCMIIYLLVESWVEFSKSGTAAGEELASCSHHCDLFVSPPTAPSLGNSSVERLLIEAQKESSGPSSYINSRASSQERCSLLISRYVHFALSCFRSLLSYVFSVKTFCCHLLVIFCSSLLTSWLAFATNALHLAFLLHISDQSYRLLWPSDDFSCSRFWFWYQVIH